MREMERLVSSYARHSGVNLLRHGLATSEEVMAVQCPRHGWDPCWNLDGTALSRGCLARQIEALRSDYFPPQQAAFGGSPDDGSCVMEVHHGA